MNYPYFWQTNSILSYLMIPFSWIFKLLTYIRYKKAKPLRVGNYVICVGNVTAGGTGKTQLIKWLANYLSAQEVDFVIITKGYNSKLNEATFVTSNHNAEEVGDESLELLKVGKVIASPSIIKANTLIDQTNAKVILVDDGLQNPNFIKDMSILLVDPMRGNGNGRIIPAGPMREEFSNGAARADIIISVGDDTNMNPKLKQLIEQSEKPYIKAAIKPSSVIDHNKKYIAFCGIGNPDKFFTSLNDEGLNVIEKISFADHHNYSNKDLGHLHQLADENNAELITTRKDYVKLPEHKNINVLDVELDFGKDTAILQQMLQKNLQIK